MNRFYIQRVIPAMRIFVAILSFVIVHEQLAANQPLRKSKTTFSEKNMFHSNVFCENNGVVDNRTGQKIFYYANHGHINAFFTAKGIFYSISQVNKKEIEERKKEKEKEKGKKEKEGDEDEMGIPAQTNVVAMEWVGANPDVQIEAGEKEQGEHTYLKKEGASYKTLRTNGYKTIRYKNLYPGIDVEYSFPENGLPENWETGMKYDLIVHPGADISKVKINYSGAVKGLQKDREGNITIHATTGDIVERAPFSFTEDKQAVASSFKLDGNTIQFKFTEGYNPSQTVTIDPWIGVLTSLPPVNMGLDVDYDNFGDLYVYGAGPTDLYDATDFFEVAKYDPNGNVLWTFNGSVPSIGWNSTAPADYLGYINLPSNFVVDKVTGKTYVGKAFDGNGTSTIRLDANGNYDNFVSAIDPNFLETWDFAYNCSNGDLLALGGGTVSNLNMGVINTTTAATTTSNFTTIPYPYAQDIVSGAYDSAGNLYVIMNSASYSLPYFNTLYKVNAAYNNNIWAADAQFETFNEVENDPDWDYYDLYNGNAYNALAANGSYLYYYDGQNVAAFDLGSGNMVGTPYYLYQYYYPLYQGGIAVDNCNNVYVGGDGVINTFTFNGSSFTPGADISLGNAFQGVYIHDVRYNPSNNLLYITGDNVVGTITATLSGACNPPQTFKVGVSNTCSSGTAHVSPSSGLTPKVFTYIWTDSLNNIVSQTTGSTDTINIVNSLSNGKYIVQVEWNSNCGGTTIYDTINIQCNITHSPDTTICAGQPVNLTANVTGSSGGTYSWSPGGATGPSVTVSPTTTTTYTVTYTPTSGSVITATITVTVLNAPTVTVNSTSVCTGSQATLTAVPSIAGGTYSWSPGGYTTGSINVSPSTTTPYTVTYTSACGTATATGTVTVTQTPTITANNDTICIDGTAQIWATTSIAGGTYSWSPGEYTTDTITVSPESTTPYTVTYSTPGCGSITATGTVDIASNPTVTASNANICMGGSAQISATPSTGGGAYSWSPGEFGDTSSITVNPSDTTIYTVSYLLSGCSVASATSTVNVTPPPTLITMGDTICMGDTAQISAIPSVTGGTYQWLPGGATTSAVNVTPAANATYVVTYTLTPCSVSDTVAVKVNPVPNISLTIINASCAKNNGIIVSNPTGATSPYTYLWSNEDTTQTDTALSGGVYKVTITDANQCSASATGTVTQSGNEVVKDTVALYLCSQPPYGDVTITSTGGTSPYTYQVTDSTTITNNTGQFNNVAPGNYTYVVTDSLGCIVNGSFAVPEGYAKDSFTIAADSASCFGLHDGGIVVTPVVSPNPAYTYSLNGQSAQPGGVFDSLGTGSYQVVVFNGVGCTDTLSTTVYQPAQLSVSFNPDTVIIADHDSVTLTPDVNNFINPVYVWSPSQGLSCDSCSNPVASVTAPTVYYVLVSDSLNKNCNAYDSVIILVKGLFGMPDAFSPNGDGRNDLFGPVSLSNATIKAFRIYNRWGQLVHNSNEPWDGKFKSEDQPPGTYIYYIEVQYPNPENPSAMTTSKTEGSVVLLR